VKKIGLCAVLAGVAAGVATLFGTVNGTASALRAGHKTAAVMSGQPKFAQESSSVVGGAGHVKFACQARTTRRCFGPDQIRAAYGVQTLLNHGITGAGRTIVIIDAYGSSTIAADLANFDTTWGIPASTLHVIAPYGIDPTDPNNAFGWAVETSLDVEWAHVIAPGATINLVLAKSNADADILAATAYALDHNLGDVVSQSFGEAEQCMDPALLDRQHKLFKRFADRGVTLFAASGDSGSAQPTCDGSAYFKAASTPASDPLVTAVGGTKLTADLTSGAYGSETTWNETVALGSAAAGGGGLSVVFKRPGFQDGVVDGRMRGLPDISYNAAVDGGVITLVGPLVFRVGGTSAGSPQWAGLAALADQLANGRVGQINPTLYRFGKSSSSSSLFHDVTIGDNALPAGFGGPIPGFTATTGYDLATGWGSPIANNLVPALAAKGDDVRGGSDNQGGGGDNQGGGGGNQGGGGGNQGGGAGG
jgi:subtilase family serine protease